ncbi:MAG: hypothetical protein Q7T85_09215 [Nitrosomonas sp.]|nr:hypothetical protein [Nitrosomonas sp.]
MSDPVIEDKTSMPPASTRRYFIGGIAGLANIRLISTLLALSFIE